MSSASTLSLTRLNSPASSIATTAAKRGSDQDKAFEEIEDERLSATYSPSCSWPSPALLVRIARIAVPVPSSSSQSPRQRKSSTCSSLSQQVGSAVVEQRMIHRLLELKDLRALKELAAPANKHSFNHTSKAITTAVDTTPIGSASNKFNKGDNLTCKWAA